MSLENYYKKITKQHEETIAIDFDGVIHKNSKGFFDGTVYDEPIKGTKEALKNLSQKYKLIIFTCKAKPDRPLIDNKTGKELISEWLSKYNLLQYVDNITSEKPRAKYYIDDKAVYFLNWENTINEITNR